jgi:hypothetical protein
MKAEIGSLTENDTYVVTCQACGNFEISEEARTDLRQAIPGKKSRRYLLSAMAKTAPLRSAARLYVDQKLVADADEGRLPEPRRKEKRESLLRWYADLSEKDGSRYGARVPVVLSHDYPAAYCREAQSPEWHFLFDQLKEKYIKMHGEEQLWITDAGWEFLEEHPSASGAQVFVAMAFDGMDDVWLALRAAIGESGYRALRIDKSEFVGGVMDEIKARIRESHFVVVDLTGNRGGVYYEAGFADALMKKVIFTCRHDHLNPKSKDRVHFDVQHLNMIAWKPKALGELTLRLKNRIEGTFGRGPVK